MTSLLDEMYEEAPKKRGKTDASVTISIALGKAGFNTNQIGGEEVFFLLEDLFGEDIPPQVVTAVVALGEFPKEEEIRRIAQIWESFSTIKTSGLKFAEIASLSIVEAEAKIKTVKTELVEKKATAQARQEKEEAEREEAFASLSEEGQKAVVAIAKWSQKNWAAPEGCSLFGVFAEEVGKEIAIKAILHAEGMV